MNLQEVALNFLTLFSIFPMFFLLVQLFEVETEFERTIVATKMLVLDAIFLGLSLSALFIF